MPTVSLRAPATAATGGPDGLNPEQRAAVVHGADALHQAAPLLVLAGAGTGKTATLAHRVAWLVGQGVAPERILLLTFSRRAAAEMIHRAGAVLAQDRGQRPGHFKLPWAGTFHSVAAQLLRQHAPLIGLNPHFTIMDRGDSVDLFDWLRDQRGLTRARKRFPRAATCLGIYSDVTNTGLTLAAVLAERHPWCESWQAELQGLMRAYVERKQQLALLDFDDLLLWWRHAMEDAAFAQSARARFDHVLVDEYQDSNRLQVELLASLRPSGHGLFVVGDDAQSIYAFRGADVEHIYRFRGQFSPPATHVSLHRNYRSTQAVLDAANALIADAGGPFDKALSAASARCGPAPRLVTVADDAAQSAYLIGRILERREQGVPLRRQAVLFRNGHHSDGLEIELTRHKIPFVKYGGLKFVEAAHIKDALALLRWAFNPRDQLAAFRALQLVSGMGPVLARACLERLQKVGAGEAAAAQGAPQASTQAPTQAAPRQIFATLAATVPRGVCAQDWAGFCALLDILANDTLSLEARLGELARWLALVIADRYDDPQPRVADLDMLGALGARFRQLADLISALALDPPNATGGWGDDALRDEDYLILSTVHSAKGQEWQSVYLINVADGNFPNEFATDKPAALAEERRLLYVAMTRARDHLELIEPVRYYLTQQQQYGGAHVQGARSRFLTAAVLARLECVGALDPVDTGLHENGAPNGSESAADAEISLPVRANSTVGARILDLWR